MTRFDDRRTFLRLLAAGTAGAGFGAAAPAPAAAAGVFPDPPTVEWSITYDERSDDGAASVAPIRDGYAFAGTTASSDGPGEAWAVAVDGEGDERWNDTYGGGGAVGIVTDADGDGAVFAGSTAGDERSFRLTQLDAAGEVVWEQRYANAGTDGIDGTGPWDDVAADLVAASDGGYLVVGSRIGLETEQTGALLVKTDASGRLQWATTCGYGRGHAANAAVETADGYVFAGETSADDGSHGLLTAVDADGDVTWENTYPQSSEAVNARLTDVAVRPNGSVTAVGKSDPIGLSEWALGVDSDGNQEYSVLAGNSFPNAVVAAPDGGALVAGVAESPAREFTDAGYLRRIDGSGEEVWFEYFADANVGANALVEVRGAGLLLAGRSGSADGDDYDGWLAKLTRGRRRGSDRPGRRRSLRGCKR